MSTLRRRRLQDPCVPVFAKLRTVSGVRQLRKRATSRFFLAVLIALGVVWTLPACAVYQRRIPGRCFGWVTDSGHQMMYFDSEDKKLHPVVIISPCGDRRETLVYRADPGPRLNTLIMMSSATICTVGLRRGSRAIVVPLKCRPRTSSVFPW